MATHYRCGWHKHSVAEFEGIGPVCIQDNRHTTHAHHLA